MKRQRRLKGEQDAAGGVVEAALTPATVAVPVSKTASSSKKTRKVVVDQKEKEVGLEVGRRETGECSGAAAAAAAAAAAESLWGCDEWPVAAVEEQMWWRSSWSPFWDVELMGEANHSALFSDVVWDMDIWNLNGTS
ncbi:uncharacterized protein LOC131154570 [Malania oleifera]|uniref:uncharacterized protein LOC131154570 n=1 Tax=Malania oleifera TaxID=397392 RepID=UPI0025AE94C4|nr:uncharacterized protein LOC131154570 [Malania oleifera]